MTAMNGQVTIGWLPRALRPFRHRDYRFLIGSMTISLFAGGMWLVALVWQVIALGGTPTELSVVATATSVGLLASILVGGLAADRLPRRALLIVVEVVRIVTAAAAGLLALSGHLQLWHLAVIAFVVGAAEAFFIPAYTALLPTLMPPDELLAANGVEGALRPVTQNALGPAAAGVIVGVLVPGVALLAAAGLYLVALLALVAMRTLPVPAPSDGASVLGDLREGFAYMFRTRWLFATLAFASLYVLVSIGPIEVLLPFAVRDQTGSGAGGFAFVLAGFGLGGALGSLTVSSFRVPRRYLTVMIMTWGVGALPLVLIGATNLLWLMAIATFLTGFSMSVGMVIWGTLLQRRVPPHLLGRVSSLDFFVSLALMPVSMALAGPVGEWIGIPLTFVLAGTVPVLLGVAAVIGWRLPTDEIAHPLDLDGAVSALPAEGVIGSLGR